MVRVLRKGATSWQVRLLAPWMISSRSEYYN